MVTNNMNMTRTISPSLAGVLERLELEQPGLVTSKDLTRILEGLGIKTPTRIIAARLRERGWLLSTGRSGVWEFAPAALAGAYSRWDPFISLQTVLACHPQLPCALTFQSAAWAHGVAERLPKRLELAVDSMKHANRFIGDPILSTFNPVLSRIELKGVPVLAIESLVVHTAAKPADLRSWHSALEWLPDLATELDFETLIVELSGQSKAVGARTGYLLQGLRPDLSAGIYQTITPSTKTWFGPRGPLLRHDNCWLIADTILPFSPRELERVK